MSQFRNIAVGAAVAGLIGSLTPLLAQTTSFRNYRCADGTEFIVGSYPYDPQVYLQIDGGPVTLRPRPALSGKRYSGSGVTLKVNRAGRTSVKRPNRRETACEPI